MSEKKVETKWYVFSSKDIEKLNEKEREELIKEFKELIK